MLRKFIIHHKSSSDISIISSRVFTDQVLNDPSADFIFPTLVLVNDSFESFILRTQGHLQEQLTAHYFTFLQFKKTIKGNAQDILFLFIYFYIFFNTMHTFLILNYMYISVYWSLDDIKFADSITNKLFCFVLLN